MNLSAVPAIYYHSVKYKVKDSWVHPHITMPLDDFNRHINLYRSLKANTYFMDDLYYHLEGDKKLPFNSLIIHFDDGYLDNFIFAFPLLKKHKLKATIWVNPDFIDEDSHEIRPTLEEYWNGKLSLEELNSYDGFINWEEMRLMEKSGFIEIQSHTMTHNKYPISENIIDFVSPTTKIDWLHWILFPEDKPKFLTDQKNQIPFGYPIYESQKGNIAIKCEENGELAAELVAYVNQSGGENFFNKTGWKDELFDLAESLKKNYQNLYKKETEDEYIFRIRKELLDSKYQIESKLGKKVNHLCWPYGAWNEMTEKLALECGYLTTSIRGEKNIFNKKNFNRVDRIALDNPKYQNQLFCLYGLCKLISYKF